METMENNRNSTQSTKLLNPGTCTQLKEAPEGPFPQVGEDFHLNLYDSLESDSDSLIQERQYQLELQNRIQDNENMVTLEDAEFDTDNGEEDGWNLYDSLEDAEDEHYEEKIEPEHKDNSNIRHQTTDRYANLRYNPNWRNTSIGAKILMSRQNCNSTLHDSLENLLQESNKLLEKNEGKYSEHQDKLEQKRQTNKACSIGFSLSDDDDNVEKQPKRKRPSSPYIKCEASIQEEIESLDSSEYYDLQNQSKTRTDKIIAKVSQESHEDHQCNDEDNCEMFCDSECEHLDSLEQKRQTDKSQGVKFSLREGNSVQKQSERKHLPSYPNSERSTQDCEPLNSPRFYTDTIKSDLQNCKKTEKGKFSNKDNKDKYEKNEDHNEEVDYESLNDHYQKEYQQFLECESTCSDVSIKRVKQPKNPVISHDRKLQTKVRLQDDIVERNKQTLGRHKMNSYQLLYSEKKEVKGTQQLSSAKSSKLMNTDQSIQHVVDGEECSTIEMKWKQKAQKLQNQKAKQLSARKKGLTSVVKERSSRPPNEPSSKLQMQKSQVFEDQRHQFESVVHPNKNTSDLLIMHRDDNNVLLTPGSDQTFTSSSVNQIGPAFVPNSLPTVNLNINLNTLSSGGNTQTTVKLVPSHHPMSQTASVCRDDNIYNTSQNPVPYLQECQKNPESWISHFPNQLNTNASHFSKTLYVPENTQHQLLCNIQPPFYTQYGKTEHSQMLNPNYHQAAYARTLAPDLCNYSHLQRTDIAAGNSQFHPMNQEKITRQDHNQLGKKYGNSRFPLLSFLPSYQQHLVQSPSTRLIQQMEHIYEGTPRPLHTHPGCHLVLPPIGLMRDSDSEPDQTQPNEKKEVTISRCNSDGYLAQMEKVNKLKGNNKYKPYTLKDYKSLKQDVKLGGLGPDYKSAPEKAKKMKRQKEYATYIKSHNMKAGSKSSSSQLKPCPGIENKTTISRRKLALEYARNIQKPKPLAAKPGDANEKSERSEFPEHGQYVQLDPSHNNLLAMLQQRHEKEKQIVAGFTAMHVS
ncbi:jhy protein homolog isoform X2 [Stegostoma tigrinum]|uniref:jhy protein homolog isoform X2 n=1 Tax=Stegostoma tigrinum TaxID=3053191 RepID=UPI00286FB249|nr:jhy protein homolog isoform X2 [Stegostoma tigrinum]